jgi:soluble lytic murein transglycosylase
VRLGEAFIAALGVAVFGAQACTGPAGKGTLNAGSQVTAPRVQATPDFTAPVETWRSAARVNDWPSTARRIDALPEEERAEPGVRYARALAAARLADCHRALAALDGLAARLPLLFREIAEMTARCQLEVGPFEAAASYFTNQGSPQAWLEAARAWERAGQLERARELLDKALGRLSSRPANHTTRIAAHRLRAELAERMGQRTIARNHYRWLATVAAVPGADDAYEKLARAPLTKGERFARAQAMAARGNVAGVTRELGLLEGAPGQAPQASALLRVRAKAYYRSRSDDAKAAVLFEEAARRSRGTRVADLFDAARAWTRARQADRALAMYRKVAEDHSGTSHSERARYRLARLNFSSGRWDEAERAYTHYLRRYARSSTLKGALSTCRYERAVAQLAGGRPDAALEGFQRLIRSGGGGYTRSMLQHLEAVALAASDAPARQALAVGRFEAVIRKYPLSFAALASAARLERLGQHAHHPLPKPPARTDFWPGGIPELMPKARLLLDLGLYSAAERALHSREHTLRQHFSPRGAEALCGLYESVDRGWRRYALATATVKNTTLRRAPTASNIWAWQCLFPRPYGEAVARLEERHRLPTGLLHSVMRQESAFRPDARSPVGAIGLMQLMPKTAERAAAELDLPHRPDRLEQVQYNLELGAFYLGKLLDDFDRQVVLALASYNAGPHAAMRWLDGGQDLPLDLWVARIPFTETRHYVMRVMASWARYRYLAGGPPRVPRVALDVPVGLELASNAY